MTLAVNIAQSGSNNVTFRNRVINGAMVLDQRNAGAAVTATGVYALDRYIPHENTDGAYTVQQVTTAPAGFSYSMKATVTTADTSIGASQNALISQYIEGYNVSDLGYGTANAQTVTLSFWVNSAVTGTFSGSLQNSASDRSYPFSYTISTANTWEQKSVTIAGDTSGTWIGATNGVGLRVWFALAAGSSLVTTAGAWAAGTYYGATGQANWMATLGNTFYITGVQLEAGTTASPFEYRQYGTELALCQRYYQLAGMGLTYYNATGSQQGRFMGTPCVTPRTSPTFTLVSSNVVGNVSSATPSSYNSGATIHLQVVSSAGSGSYTDANYTYSLSAEL